MVRPIKILHVINSLHFGGAESLLRDIIFNSDKGHFEHVVCYLRRYGSIGEQLDKNGVKVMQCHPLPRISFLLKFKKVLEAQRPSIIHTHLHLDNFWIAIAKKMYKHSRMVSHIHNIHVHKGTLRRVRAYMYMRFVANQSDKMIAVSKQTIDHAKGYFGISENKLVLINNAIDITKFDPQKVNSCSNGLFSKEKANTFIIGSVGNISEQKDYWNLIRAIWIVVNRNPDISIKALIAGKQSHLLAELEARIENLGLKKNIYFLGAIDWVPEFLRSIDVYVQSSKYEGLPCAVLEAMAMQKPIVATKVSGSEEIIQDGVSGILVPPEDPNELAAAIERMLSFNAEDRIMFGVAARKRVIHNYSMDSYINNIMQIYRDVLR